MSDIEGSVPDGEVSQSVNPVEKQDFKDLKYLPIRENLDDLPDMNNANMRFYGYYLNHHIKQPEFKNENEKILNDLERELQNPNEETSKYIEMLPIKDVERVYHLVANRNDSTRRELNILVAKLTEKVLDLYIENNYPELLSNPEKIKSAITNLLSKKNTIDDLEKPEYKVALFFKSGLHSV